MYELSFNGDIYLQETFTKLFKLHQPDMIIETGTYMGDTTEFLSSFNIPVITTEINKHFYNLSCEKLKSKTNVSILLGDSENKLNENIDKIINKKILFFLDSHFLNDNVLERELILLKNLLIKPIIIIHDFYVPNKDFAYDVWDGHRYDYDFYKEYFDKLFGEDKYTYKYNTEALGARVGVIILEPID